MKRSSRFKLLGAVVLAGSVAAIAAFLPVKQSFQDFFIWVDGLGAWGPAMLAAAYVPACVLFVPGSIMTLGAGFAFGVVKGTIAVSIGSTLGVAAAFWVGRTLARSWIESLTRGRAGFQAVDRAVAREGFKIVLLTRLSPAFPFAVLNYFYGLTTVRFRDYLLASWVGMLPGTVLYVYLGSAVQSLADVAAGNMEGGIARKVLFGVGLVATLIVTVLVTRVARKSLHEAVPVAHGAGEPMLAEVRS
jgi:uncharacterized membrane protein YdjX (TVP38/TMEM64 family)